MLSLFWRRKMEIEKRKHAGYDEFERAVKKELR